ncbi:MAG: universal stress protein [Bacteroidota bacterium]|nr:universal stress protein [Bacteroidota bacterium]
MILVQIQQINTGQILLQSALTLAAQLKKTLGVFSFVDANEHVAAKEDELNALLAGQHNTVETQILVRDSKTYTLPAICEEMEASFLFIQLPDGHSKFIRTLLNDCRDLRIPYLFYKDSFKELNLAKVILPIGFLEEELEKAQFATAFGRFCGSEVKMLLANDYGSKAATNADKMKLLFDKFAFRYTLEKAQKDSFKVEAESIQLAEKEQAGIIIVSASRDYGLDDILFGPKEYHILKKSPIPVLLVNPRGDLYALCD